MDTKEKEKLISAWIRSAQEELDLACELYVSKRHAHCLFFCQLALEKSLKALIIKKQNTYPLPIHKLARLAKIAGIILTEKQTEDLNEITTFNIEARYDILKEQLYKKADSIFTEKYLNSTKSLFTYFISLI